MCVFYFGATPLTSAVGGKVLARSITKKQNTKNKKKHAQTNAQQANKQTRT
jgi:hypothetical protein